ncbi:Aste57867_1101 [Aphanomyces stellatus]|uniref:Aste57867_1101 protein n=1 Tax=Aphanomyces stellatus TaxID=120398 RepID=A0A485K8H9_9STRA|nr:hypothetical protein As57867_001100 [Aphanomyces stellatus]VFT78322.1 Aste57867_1101 [Aphanomyces stellatus]
MGCHQSTHDASTPLPPRHTTTEQPPPSSTNLLNYNSAALGSDDTMFQYGSGAPSTQSYEAPPPATLGTDTFIANELGQYTSGPIDNIWSDPRSTRPVPAAPMTNPDSGRNIWTIQSAQPSWRNIWGLLSQSKNSATESAQGNNLWNYHSNDSDVKNVWSTNGGAPSSSQSASGRPPLSSQSSTSSMGRPHLSGRPPMSLRAPPKSMSNLNVIDEDSIVHAAAPPSSGASQHV